VVLVQMEDGLKMIQDLDLEEDLLDLEARLFITSILIINLLKQKPSIPKVIQEEHRQGVVLMVLKEDLDLVEVLQHKMQAQEVEDGMAETLLVVEAFLLKLMVVVAQVI